MTLRWSCVFQEIYRLTLAYKYAVILLTLSLVLRLYCFARMLIFFHISSPCVDAVSLVQIEINIVCIRHYLYLNQWSDLTSTLFRLVPVQRQPVSAALRLENRTIRNSYIVCNIRTIRNIAIYRLLYPYN